MERLRVPGISPAMRTALLALTISASLPGFAWAQATEDEKREACGPDVMQYCASEIPNRTRIAACLRSKRNQISSECRVILDGGRPARGTD